MPTAVASRERRRQQDDQLAATACLVYDLGRGGFSHLDLTDKHGAEAIERGAPIPGEIRIGDRNFGRAANLHRFRQQSANQADFIVRVGWNAFSLTRLDGAGFDLITHLGTLPADMTPHEMMLRARVGVLDPPLPLRLIVRRKTPENDRSRPQQVARRGFAQAEGCSIRAA